MFGAPSKPIGAGLTRRILLPGSRPNRQFTPTTRGLIGRWALRPPFKSGTNYRDLTGLKADAVASGTPAALIQGPLGPTYLLNGTSQFFTIPARVWPTTAFSATCWLYYRVDPVNVPGIIDTWTSAASHVQLIGVPGGNLFCRIGNVSSGGSNHIGRSTAGISAGAWHHIAMVWSGGTTSASITTYVDGVRWDNADDNSGSFTAASSSSLAALVSNQSATASSFLDGAIDEIRIYNRALALSEIQQLYRNPTIDYITPIDRIWAEITSTSNNVSASIAATDSGATTAAIAATVGAVTAAIAATDSGATTAAIAATVGAVTADIAATDSGATTAAITASDPISASIAATDSDGTTASLTANNPISASIAATDSDATTAALAATVGAVTAAIAATDSGATTAALAATVGAVTASIAPTDSGATTAAITADDPIGASIAATDSGATTAALAATVGSAGAVTGTLAATISGLTVADIQGYVGVVNTTPLDQTGFPPAPIGEGPPGALSQAVPMSWMRRVVSVLNNTQAGKLNCTGFVTLTPGGATTTIIDPRIGPFSHIMLAPLSANAAGVPWYISAQQNGQATITHDVSAALDRTFTYAIIG